jgi:hypothetical protein
VDSIILTPLHSIVFIIIILLIRINENFIFKGVMVAKKRIKNEPTYISLFSGAGIGCY